MTFRVQCTKCGEIYPAGAEHICKRQGWESKSELLPSAYVNPKAPVTTRPSKAVKSRPNTVITESVTTQPVTTPSKPKRTVTTSDKDRVARWRNNNRERYNSYMREYRARQ